MSFILRPLFKFLSKKSLPKTNISLDFPQLKEKVEIIRDTWGIPHIYAKNTTDLCFAIGYVHAQDRLWQMELLRRTASGTLSEVFGELSLDTDKLLRVLGFRRLAKDDVDRLPIEMKEQVQAYADGVNALIMNKSFKLPLEFGLVKHKPEPWTSVDSMAFGRLMQFQLNGPSSFKLALGKVESIVGIEKINELFPDYPKDSPSVLPEGIEEFLKQVDGTLKAFQGPFLPKTGGSNSWAISGDLTESGMPIHCSDPHLAPSLPSIWYLGHYVSDEINVIGVGPPVIPAILIGHNENCAWGFTVSNVDAEDLFIEKMNPDDPLQYEFKREWKPVEILKEEIYVKGRKEPISIDILKTHHGPLIDGAVDYSSYLSDPMYRLSLSSYAILPGDTVKGMMILNKAKGWDDFCRAMQSFGAPNQNVTYADRFGNIGSYISGKIPIRSKSKNFVPVPGWTGEFDWTGEIPFEKVPHCLNPTKKFVVCANNRPVVPEKYPYYIGNNFDPGFRAKQIEKTIQSKEKISMDDCKTLHMNVFSNSGKEFVKRLDGIDESDRDVRLALRLLREWDLKLTETSLAACIFEVAKDTLLEILFQNQLPDKIGLNYQGVGYHPLLKATTEGFHSSVMMILKLMDSPDSSWLKDLGGRDQWISDGLKKTVEICREKMGLNVKDWQWGKLHKISFPHAMSMKKPLDEIFNVGPRPIGGDGHTVCQMCGPPKEYDNIVWCPSYRHIVDFSDLSKSVVIYAPGQSGNLSSPHYSDLFEPWVKGEYIPMLWTREQVEANKESNLILGPKK